MSRTKTVTGIVLGLIALYCISFAVAQPLARPTVQQPTRFWQDVIRKPNQNWSSNVLSEMPEATQAILALDRLFKRIAENDSQLAAAAWEENNQLKIVNSRIASLVKRVAALERAALVTEPNEVAAEDPNGVESGSKD